MSAKAKVLVAMSGGVDSSVAACLLKEQGYDVAGATIQMWVSGSCEAGCPRARRSIEAVEDARSVARKLGIPHFVLDLEKEFKEEVVDYFVSEYLRGRTPNPCVVCNEKIKFGRFWQEAVRLGFDHMATGHYARMVVREARYLIREGIDPSKDQSYFLFSLPQAVLPHTLFPLGGKKKDEVREAARSLGLRVARKPDSMEICFVPKDDYSAFLRDEAEVPPQKGLIRFKDGTVLGEHSGFFNYTVGQRRGLGVAFREPLYVIEIRSGTNEVIVGLKDDVLSRKFRVTGIRWQMDPAAFISSGGRQMNALVKIRANFEKAGARIAVSEDGLRAEVTFDEPAEAVTPGQAAVFYDGQVVLGGGWIGGADTEPSINNGHIG